jgi:hypothetical protein
MEAMLIRDDDWYSKQYAAKEPGRWARKSSEKVEDWHSIVKFKLLSAKFALKHHLRMEIKANMTTMANEDYHDCDGLL